MVTEKNRFKVGDRAFVLALGTPGDYISICEVTIAKVGGGHYWGKNVFGFTIKRAKYLVFSTEEEAREYLINNIKVKKL